MDYINKSKEDLIKEIQSLQQENYLLRSSFEDKSQLAASQIKESEEKFKVILEKSLSSMLIADDQGNYIAANEASAKLFGYSVEELQKMNVGHLITISHPSASERYAEYMIKGEEIGEFDFVSKDGIPKVVQYQAIRIKPNFNLSIMMDITSIKKIEQEQKINLEKLETLNKTKDKFFSIIAHDLRNPFIGIVRLAEVIESRIKETDQFNSNILQYIEIIRTSSQSGFDLLENLMHWAKTQTGEIEFHPNLLSMNRLISQCMNVINGNAFNKNISIDIHASDEDTVFADEALSCTVIRNLLTNAIKFTHPNGRISISTNRINIFLEISIKDNGIGIDKRNLDKIFSIDSKSSNLGTNKETGTGLGLILCKEFVEIQGGKIFAKSEKGQGSEFTFTLPLPD
ncbi:MAG: PAS domain S-box protein [Leptospiraceae bacterium]|nr:PAS domain S-box protein [Leptospiraceae bacterium]